MSKCPTCGNVIKEEVNSQNKPWADFVFNKESYPVFKLILEKFLIYLRFNNISNQNAGQMNRIITTFKLTKQPVPFDVKTEVATLRAGLLISLCAILEYFHNTKIGPNSHTLRDTKVKNLFKTLRHECAHIIMGKERFQKASKELFKLGVDKVSKQVAAELFEFIVSGMDKYFEMGISNRKNFGNTSESRYLLKLINSRRSKDGREPI
jgi:hypothetical protein